MNPKPLPVCLTCPFRKANQGQKHHAGWYKISNLRRLWNGLRKGIAPGMICHSSDPNNVDYGGTNMKIRPGAEHQCAGALQLIYQHVNEAGACKTLREYRSHHKTPLTLNGLRRWVERKMLPPGLPNIIPADDVGLPWEMPKGGSDD